MGLVIGFKELDEIYPGLIGRSSITCIEGPPGSGKSIVASSICYHNASNGDKCLYVSFYEDREKHYNTMRDLGYNFHELEDEKLIYYEKLDITNNMYEILDRINELIFKVKPSLVIIDPIDILLYNTRSIMDRARLVETIGSIPKENGSGLILTAGIEDGPYLKDIELISDTVIELKADILGGFVTRLLRIKKSRNLTLELVEFPFIISRDLGVKIFVLEQPKTIVSSRKYYRGMTSFFQKYIEYVEAGEHILAVYPPYIRLPHWNLLLLEIAVANDLKILFISYHYSPEETRSILERILVENGGVDNDTARMIIDRYMVLKSINPYAYSLTELAIEENNLVKRYNPDIVYFHGLELLTPIIAASRYQYYKLLVNQVYSLKNRGVTTVRSMSMISKKRFLMESALADIVIQVIAPNRPWEPGILYIWRKGRRAQTLVLDRASMENIRKDYSKAFKAIIEELKGAK